ncbi:uncharacterized protein LOC135209583 [Macrobrachium nipponense]|uniref:uncharacterized protein LOC135209583 n=1 Tax=Macrobrachium nipponense TaxID=159736 RepID=UPI0030C89259
MERDTPPPVPECTFTEVHSGMKLYALEKKLLVSYEPKIKIMTIGSENDLETKTIMLLGATGAGKTCLINALVNHILGVKFEDNFRYVLKDETGDSAKKLAESQTEYVVGYLVFALPGSNCQCNYLIVDTPGFKDSRGQEKDAEVTHQLRTFLHDVDGVDELNLIGFVVNGTTARLQDQFSEIIETFCEMFGENAKGIIRILITFCHMKKPPVLNVLECSCLRDYKTYQFDNIALRECNTPNDENSQEDVDMYKIYWNNTARIYDSIFSEVDHLNAVSLTVTREALEDIERLSEILDKMKTSVESYLDRKVELRALEKQSSAYRAIMDVNKDWKGTVSVTVRERLKPRHQLRRLRTHTHRLEERPVIHEDKKAAYEDAERKEASVQQDVTNLADQIHITRTAIEGEVSDVVSQSAKISSVSLQSCHHSPVNYIEATLNLVKVERLQQSSQSDEQLGYVIPILDELKEHLLHHHSL